MVFSSGTVKIVEEGTPPLDGGDPEVGQAEVLVANHGIESPNNKSKVEEAVPARKSLYPPEFGVTRAEGPLGGLEGALTAEEASPGGGLTLDMDDDAHSPLPTSRDKSKEADHDADKSSSKDDDMPSRLRADVSRLERELRRSNDELKLAFDGQQALRNEYDNLSSEVIYEIKLHNPRFHLSYMGSPFLERTLA
uniref:Uncharacterized protein n=1 Tax=Cannabis sativa TaxID=3483 RepID=A0A803PZE9_CANSA